jgi:hypothetical protein
MAIVQRDLRAGDRADPERGERLRHLHRAVETVVVGQRKGFMALLGGDVRELHRMRSAIEEREGRMAVELDVSHANICSHSLPAS